jgi:preprotein translocase subunit SecE
MKFEIYKRNQGKPTRLFSGVGVAIIVALGCSQLYKQLEAAELGVWVATMIPTVVGIVLCFFTFLVLNKPVVADFMIAAEGELKKVSWSTRKEIAASTFIVIFVVVLMMILLGITDLLFEGFFMDIVKLAQ